MLLGTHSLLGATQLYLGTVLSSLAPTMSMAGSVYKGWSLRTGTVLKLIPRSRASTKHETGIRAILFFLIGVYLFCIVTELIKPFFI